LIECKDFATIELMPTDPQTDEKYYETRFLKGEQSGITNNSQQYQEKTLLQEQVIRNAKLDQSLKQIAEDNQKSYENWKNKKLPLWSIQTAEDIEQENPNLKVPDALKNDVGSHCNYEIILAAPRVEKEQQSEVCPAPKTIKSPTINKNR